LLARRDDTAVRSGADELSPSLLVRATVKLLRRALWALSLGSLIAGALRLRGKGGVPPQEGGWKELDVPPSRDG